ncbi:MAG: hypothetical protein IJR30_06305, partial [Prevotella sp.]|nr:hypothetical protein [Prevotella sp.]
MTSFRQIILFITLLLFPTLLFAQGIQRNLRFMVIDADDNSPINNYTATLMTADSTIVKTVVQKEDTTSIFRIWGYSSIPFHGKGKFILRLTSVGYEPL